MVLDAWGPMVSRARPIDDPVANTVGLLRSVACIRDVPIDSTRHQLRACQSAASHLSSCCAYCQEADSNFRPIWALSSNRPNASSDGVSTQKWSRSANTAILPGVGFSGGSSCGTECRSILKAARWQTVDQQVAVVSALGPYSGAVAWYEKFGLQNRPMIVIPKPCCDCAD